MTARTIQLLSDTAAGGWADGDSASCDISADGQLVTFASVATNLVASDPNGSSDVFATTTTTGTTSLVSRGPSGQPANNASRAPAISADGRYVAYESEASNLDLQDRADFTDIYLTRLS